MAYTKKENREYALKLLLLCALKVRGDRATNKELLEIIYLLEGKV